MAHKTLIDGTAYSVSGGKALVDGTAYSVKNGKTLVGGTVYEVGFGGDMATVTIKGTGRNSICYATIDGIIYTSAATLSVPVGTVITCSVSDGGKDGSPAIYLNGTFIYATTRYAHTITKNTSVTMNTSSYRDKDDDKYYYGTINITEE